MLSYLHAFHAGNHADILKHAALIQLLKKLNQKEAPYTFFDTHAGSGLYSTQGEKARKTGEAARGVLALAECASQDKNTDREASQAQNAGGQNLGPATDTGSSQKSAALSDYLDFVSPYLARDLYPGSPLIERAFLRPDDAHTICELHPQEFEALKENILQAQEGAAPDSRLATDTGTKTKNAPHTQILKADGLKTLIAQTPPKIKRGAVLIDPSYEEAADYEAVKKTVIAVHKKWSAGIIMIWYPLLAHRAAEIENMLESIIAAAKVQNANTNILRAEFCVDAPQSHIEMSLEENAAAKAAAAGTSNNLGSPNAPRLYGSGILVVNSPWKLDEELDAALKHLSRVPGLASEPSYSVEQI
ncbi:MAG: 23S rRNA (adenine(2030)-N(6))-methyltransferase RlmJ [Treponema sp.]|nr:23S rRNA (adenine(2030)-N(6))-methyltransferase RlmJ [Treponema sp.]